MGGDMALSKSMKWKYFVVLFFCAGVGVFLYGLPLSQKEDKFLLELSAASELNDRDISSALNNYIPKGSDLASAIAFLEYRGFTVVKTKSDDWHEELGDGEERYYAYKKERRNLIFLTTVSIVVVANGVVVSVVQGKIHIKGI